MRGTVRKRKSGGRCDTIDHREDSRTKRHLVRLYLLSVVVVIALCGIAVWAFSMLNTEHEAHAEMPRYDAVKVLRAITIALFGYIISRRTGNFLQSLRRIHAGAKGGA